MNVLIPGMHSFAPRPQNFNYIGYTQSSANSGLIAIPTGAAAGDVCYMIDMAADAASIPVTVTPSGYTTYPNGSGAGRTRAAVHYKVLTGSGDLSGNLACMVGNTHSAQVCFLLRPDAPLIGSLQNWYGSALFSTGSGVPADRVATPNKSPWMNVAAVFCGTDATPDMTLTGALTYVTVGRMKAALARGNSIVSTTAHYSGTPGSQFQSIISTLQQYNP